MIRNISNRVLAEVLQSAFVLVVGFAVAALLFTQCAQKEPVAVVDSETQALLYGYIKLEQKLDAQGRQITETHNAQVTPAQLQAYNDSIYTQIQSEIGRYIKNLQARQHLSTVTRIVERVPVHDTLYLAQNGDTLKAREFDYQDDWTQITGLILPTDSVNLSYTSRADLTINHYWQRRLFKPDVLHAKLTTNNPHLRVNRFATLNVPQEPAWHQKPGFRIASNVLMFAAGFATSTALQR